VTDDGLVYGGDLVDALQNGVFVLSCLLLSNRPETHTDFVQVYCTVTLNVANKGRGQDVD
jgi:hypothetical protein